MINLNTEALLNLDEAARYFSKICKRKRNRDVVQRWMSRGVNGVLLESISVGREQFTSEEAISRWVHRSSIQLQIKSDKKSSERFAAEGNTIKEIDEAAKMLGLQIGVGQ
ncbi:hypothetical protein OAU26_02230 [Mariniblastus sp.]|nr:hypothetical protein [bacterium]MDC0265495.1 hypothetical protein [Mariniblastus sp.]MDC3223729.1 hypothetical protein [Mariniblastus sp.]